MTQKEMIELIRQHAPKALEREIRAALNRAQDDFSSETEIMNSSYTTGTVVGQRRYTLDPQILTVKSVELDNIEIPRLQGHPGITDSE